MSAGPYSTTPIVQDAYSRTQTDLFDEKTLIGAPGGLQAFFGQSMNGGKTLFSVDSAVVEIDIIRGNERLAALVHRGENSRRLGGLQTNQESQQFSSFARQYPLVEEESDISANQLLFRRAGENPYEGRSRLQRMREIARDYHQEHVRRTVRLNEYLCAQSLFQGSQPAIFGTTDANLTYDFLRKSTHEFAATPEWDNSGTPITDLDTAAQLIRNDGHLDADMAVMDSDVFRAFIDNAQVTDAADNRRFFVVNVDSRQDLPARFAPFVAGGMKYRAFIETEGGYQIYIFVYPEVYTAAGGTATKYIPSEEVLVASSMARCDRYFGPPERLPMTASEAQWIQQLFGFGPETAPAVPLIKGDGHSVKPGMFFFDAYPAANKKSVTARTQSGAIFATTATDGYCVITGTLQ
jgi:hypothetical protein